MTRRYAVLVLVAGDWTTAETGEELDHDRAHDLAVSITTARPYPHTRVVPLEAAS